MAKFRKKPVVVEAISIEEVSEKARGGALSELPSWVQDALASDVLELGADGTARAQTLEGPHIGSSGDLMIQGVKGEIYFCKPDIFEMTYEVADDNAVTSFATSQQPSETESVAAD